MGSKLSPQHILNRIADKFPKRFRNLAGVPVVDMNTPVVFDCIEHGPYRTTPRAILVSPSTTTPGCPDCIKRARMANASHARSTAIHAIERPVTLTEARTNALTNLHGMTEDEAIWRAEFATINSNSRQSYGCSKGTLRGTRKRLSDLNSLIGLYPLEVPAKVYDHDAVALSCVLHGPFHAKWKRVRTNPCGGCPTCYQKGTIRT